jgi:hypothetical protein
MTRITFILLLTVLICSCTSTQTFKIEGRIIDSTLIGSKVYLVALDGPISRDVDSTLISDSCTFHFEKKADTMSVRIIRVPVRYPDYIEDLVVIAEAGKLHAVLSSNSHGEGTPLNNILQAWKERKHAHDSLQFQLYTKMNQAKDNIIFSDSLARHSESLSRNYKENVRQLMNDNLNNGIGLLLFKVYYHELTVDEKRRILDLTGNLYMGKDAQLKVMIENDHITDGK